MAADGHGDQDEDGSTEAEEIVEGKEEERGGWEKLRLLSSTAGMALRPSPPPPPPPPTRVPRGIAGVNF